MKIPFKFQEIDSLDYTIYKNKFLAALKKIKAKGEPMAESSSVDQAQQKKKFNKVSVNITHLSNKHCTVSKY